MEWVIYFSLRKHLFSNGKIIDVSHAFPVKLSRKIQSVSATQRFKLKLLGKVSSRWRCFKSYFSAKMALPYLRSPGIVLIWECCLFLCRCSKPVRQVSWRSKLFSGAHSVYHVFTNLKYMFVFYKNGSQSHQYLLKACLHEYWNFFRVFKIS